MFLHVGQSAYKSAPVLKAEKKTVNIGDLHISRPMTLGNCIVSYFHQQILDVQLKYSFIGVCFLQQRWLPTVSTQTVQHLTDACTYKWSMNADTDSSFGLTSERSLQLRLLRLMHCRRSPAVRTTQLMCKNAAIVKQTTAHKKISDRQQSLLCGSSPIYDTSRRWRLAHDPCQRDS